MGAPPEFDNGHPYCGIAGELLADLIAFAKMVEGRRPESLAIPGSYVLTVHADDGAIVLGKRLADRRVAVVESVQANPHDPPTFGASNLPIPPDDGRGH